MSEPIHIISLGAGVQSSTMALMAACGEITPMPKAAVFADTGDEPSEVYEYLSYLKPLLNFPVYEVKRSRLSDDLLLWGHSQIPAFKEGKLGKRQCTKHWKIEPVHKKMRELAGITNQRTQGIRVVAWLGISVDEVHRAKDSRDRWLESRFPLLERRMNRRDCLNWINSKGFKTPPKSACVYCPFRSRPQWKETKSKGGRDWELCISVSRKLEARGEFLTADCLPIDECDFSTEEERGQLNMFNNECEGVCGV